ncbi:uncharacterized protein LOC143257249 [Tachypleus tridentatus]|uniref:uncharacterized protein LOC143257249 n=1 Tax=Tachypleus tridentatus TaxID=6853 RepID=UPI003FD2E477
MSPKVILLCVVGCLTTVICQQHTADHSSPVKDTHDSKEEEVPVARALQLSHDIGEGKDSSFRHEERLPNGGVKGSFGYRDENGDLIVRFYLADDNGYRIVKDERYPSSPIAGDGYYDKENGKGFYDRNQASQIPDSRNSDNTRPDYRNYPKDFYDQNARPDSRNYPKDFFDQNARPDSRNYPKEIFDQNVRPYSRNYPKYFFGRNVRPHSKGYPENVFDQNGRPNSRNYPENLFNRNARPDYRNYPDNNGVNSSLIGFYPLQVKSRLSDNLQYPHPVDRQRIGDRPFSISGITRYGNGFFYDPYNSFSPVKTLLPNIQQPHDGYGGFENNYHPFDANYNRVVPFRGIQRQPDPIDYSRNYFGNFRRGNPASYTIDDTQNDNVDAIKRHNQVFNRDFSGVDQHFPNQRFLTRDNPLTLTDEGPNPPQRIHTAEITGVRLVPGGIVPLYNIPIEPKPKPYQPFTTYPSSQEDGKLNQHPQIFLTSFSRPYPQSETDKALLLTNQQPSDESVFSEQFVVNSDNGYKINQEDPDFQTRSEVLQSSLKPFYSKDFSQFQTHNNVIQKYTIPGFHTAQYFVRPRFGFSNIYGTTL